MLLKLLWPECVTGDGEEMVRYTYLCSIHKYRPHKTCDHCQAVNEIRIVQEKAFDFCIKYLELKNAKSDTAR